MKDVINPQLRDEQAGFLQIQSCMDQIATLCIIVEQSTERMIHGGQLTNSFQIMKTFTSKCRNGIQWTLWSQLDDLNFADDLALLSHSQQQMQEKISVLAAALAQVGLIIHKEKTKILKIPKSNFSNIYPITLNGSPLKEVQFFTHLGSIIDQQGGTDVDVKARIGKARVAFILIKKL
ncbi:Hypothetical predicted protein [Pelobates cultripes]|uniref:Reverse transcriptase domain-containing protein n=1 Tax=Pelobates cultripes TaxID=61616 RepID=A0AAD1TJC8_PELCU|nr:Hypothetical predicted protein [Pelobates cultripes]